MSIVLNSLVLENFKGIRNLTIQFSKETTVSGANGTGKSTIVDAFTWLLWGKNSLGKTTFEVRPLDDQNVPLHYIDCSVTGILEKNGVPVKLRKVFREKWEKKKGSAEESLTGNEMIYEVNDVSVKQKEYKEKVDSLIQENVFKILTNPLFFNTDDLMSWQERRDVLITVVGGISEEEIIGKNKEYQKLFEQISVAGSDLTEFQKSVTSKRLKMKKQLEEIPVRIDEKTKELPEELNYEDIEKQISLNNERIAQIQGIMTSETENLLAANREVNERILSLQNEIFKIKIDIKKIENRKREEEDQERQEKTQEVERLSKMLAACKKVVENNTLEIENLRQEVLRKQAEKDALVKKWQKVNAETFEFDSGLCVCPLCEQELKPEAIERKEEEMRSNFIKDKRDRLEKINIPGRVLKKEIEKAEKTIPALEAEILSLQKDIPEYEMKLNKVKEELSQVKHFISRTRDDDEFKKLLLLMSDKEKQIKALETSLQKGKDSSELIQERKNLENRNWELREQLQGKTIRENGLKRIEELQKEQKVIAQAIADLERLEFVSGNFIKDKMTVLTQRVNSLFTGVQFKLFKQNLNGGEEPCCICLVNGVPFSSVNTAGQINAGIECINVISAFYKENAPIFIDGRESVTDLIPTDSQVINLVVSASDRELRIESK